MAFSFPLGILLLLLIVLGARGQPVSREYPLKAVFLYNFVQFTEWPTNAFPDATSPVVIGVLGDDAIAPALEDAVRNEKMNGRSFRIERYRRGENIRECHALFVSQSETGREEEILAALKARPILTVGESDDFVQKGGMIQFVTEKNKIRFKINVPAVRKSGLTVSSKLLRLGDTTSEQKK